MDFLLRKLPRSFKYLQIRHIYASQTNQNRQTRNAMKKIMGISSSKKMKYYETPLLPKADSFSKGSLEGKKSGSSRRASVLNKTFMRYVTDLMVNGQCAGDMQGYGIEINRVKITPDYKILKVYWIAKGSEDDELIEQVLDKNAGYLRHELSQLRVIGNVPTIQFIKDKQYAIITEVENRLRVADFGEGYEPTEKLSKFKTQLLLYSSLDSNLKEKISKLESVEDDEEEALPEMPQNVLGLNHEDIMTRIKSSINKSKKAKSEDRETFKLSESEFTDQIMTKREQRQAFKDFLQKRQIERNRVHKQEKSNLLNLEDIEQEVLEKQESFINQFDNDSPDYIEEDDVGLNIYSTEHYKR